MTKTTLIILILCIGILSYNKVVQFTRGGGYENYPQIPRSQKQACPMDCKQYAVP